MNTWGNLETPTNLRSHRLAQSNQTVAYCHAGLKPFMKIHWITHAVCFCNQPIQHKTGKLMACCCPHKWHVQWRQSLLADCPGQWRPSGNKPYTSGQPFNQTRCCPDIPVQNWWLKMILRIPNQTEPLSTVQPLVCCQLPLQTPCQNKGSSANTGGSNTARALCSALQTTLLPS